MTCHCNDPIPDSNASRTAFICLRCRGKTDVVPDAVRRTREENVGLLNYIASDGCLPPNTIMIVGRPSVRANSLDELAKRLIEENRVAVLKVMDETP